MNLDQFTSQFEPLNLSIHGVRLPTFEVKEEYKSQVGAKTDITNYEFLKLLCEKGFEQFKLDKKSEEYTIYSRRLNYELDTMFELGFIDYILMVWDVTNFCHENNIPTNYGRGSCCGSIVLFFIGVTKIDSVKYELYFERFISKIRSKKSIVDGVVYLDGKLLCDIDLDISFYDRDKVIKYLEQKYKGRICKILTFTTLSSKLLIKECGKIVGGKSEDEMNSVSNMIPKLHGILYDINEAYHGIKDKQTGDWKLEPVKELIKWCDDNKKIYEVALKLKDLIKNTSIHPSALCISYGTLDGFIPVQLDSNKDLVTSYDMDWVSLFNIKLDILGLRGVSVVDDVCKNIGIKMNDIDFEDPVIYRNLQELQNPHGIFQLETDMTLRVSNKVKPKNLEELSSVIALSRPGASQFIDQYANYTNFGQYEPIHPFFDDILKSTGGIATFQEILMQMAHKVGFTLDEAEVMRRIVGKKKVEEVKQWKEKIDNKIKENNLDPKIATILWTILEQSASYSFNRCLGASVMVESHKGDKMLFEVEIGDKIKAFDKKSKAEIFVDVVDKIHGNKELFEVELEDGRQIQCSMDHKFMCEDGKMRTLKKILHLKSKIMCSI